MIFIKLAIVSWVLFFVVRFFVSAFISKEEKWIVSYGGDFKITPGRVIILLIFYVAVGLTVASAIWFLFFSGII